MATRFMLSDSQWFALPRCNHTKRSMCSEYQLKLFSDPKEIVGIAVRTEYQRETLRAKGFIYLSPTSGPLAPNHRRMHKKAWSINKNFALRFVVRHELGHVFGVRHLPNSVMDETWPELFVDHQFLSDLNLGTRKFFESKTSISKFLGVKDRWEVSGCGHLNPIFSPSTFGVSTSSETCGRVTLIDRRLSIEFKATKQLSFESVASADITDIHVNSTTAISVFLPRDQKVFTMLPKEARSLGRLFGESRNTSQHWKGELRLLRSGEIVPLQIQSNLDRSSGTILRNGYFENDVFFLE